MDAPIEEQWGVVRVLTAEGVSKLTNGVILLHDNARPHVSDVAQLARFKWKTLQHPLYSPDLLPCDFHILGKLKTLLKSIRFMSAVKESVADYLNQQPTKSYETGITRFVCRGDKYLNAHGDYL
ncbi:mariner Mos1 transposase [Trichonephila inaurata madagascariensis]|uniref:Mariner Mos1 transposase n=1 Tax=Trichonephila inaurata madagascariensis TaxID=2747483 RepID=A0A8X6Y9H6_9ARAC|nr:mariner Mos1 transposase [Trichonephila inaurata madagascariensis]